MKKKSLEKNLDISNEISSKVKSNSIGTCMDYTKNMAKKVIVGRLILGSTSLGGCANYNFNGVNFDKKDNTGFCYDHYPFCEVASVVGVTAVVGGLGYAIHKHNSGHKHNSTHNHNSSGGSSSSDSGTTSTSASSSSSTYSTGTGGGTTGDTGSAT